MKDPDGKIWKRELRIALILGSFLVSGCSRGPDIPAEVPYTSTNGKVVSVKEECRIVVPHDAAAPAASAGPCSDILRTARGQEYRNAEVWRKLAITYAYTSPADGDLYQGTSELDQAVSAPVPRPGDDLEVFAHPTEAQMSRLDGNADVEGQGEL